MHTRKSKSSHKHITSRLRSRASTPVLAKRIGPTTDAQRQHRKKLFQQRQKYKWLAEQRSRRERWAKIAEETQRIVLGDGKYVEERPFLSSSLEFSTSSHMPVTLQSQASLPGSSTIRVVHDISPQIVLSQQGTTFYPHYSSLLANWRHHSRNSCANVVTSIEFTSSNALAAAHQISQISPSPYTHPSSPFPNTSIGVFSFASPKRPAGGFLHGGDEQEEVLARSSSLVASLGSRAAQPFYREHRKFLKVDGSGLHDHSIVYSPGVVVFRRDDNTPDNPSNYTTSNFIAPYTINVLSAVPVNAAAVRTKHLITPSDADFFEAGIRSAMRERMARILFLAEQRGDRALVLGAFGCGSSENSVEAVAECWAELLVCGDTGDKELEKPRFKDVFDKVVFAVPGKSHESFKKAFEMRLFESQVSEAVIS